MIGRNNHATAFGEALDKGPKVVREQRLGHFFAERFKPLACDRQIVDAAVRPVMPEYPIRLRANHASAVCPREIRTFRTRVRQTMAIARSVIRKG